MSWAQLSASFQASGSDESMQPGRARQSSRGQNKAPIIVIASPHPTIVTGNIEPDNALQISAEMSAQPRDTTQTSQSSSLMASLAGQLPASTPVRQTSSGSLVMTANIKVTSSGTTFLQDLPASLPIRRRQPSAASRGSQGRSTPSGLQPRRGSSGMLQVIATESNESMGCSAVYSMQMGGTDLLQQLQQAQQPQQGMMRTGRRGSRRGRRQSIGRGSRSPSATSQSALTQGGSGQMNFVVNIPTPQDPSGSSLTVTIVQDASSATPPPPPTAHMTMSGTAIMRQT